MPRPTRRLLLALVVASLAALTAVPAAAPARTAPRCTVPMLLGKLRRPSAGAGQRYARLLLTNATRHTCSLGGYIGAQLLDARNHPLPTRVVRDRSRSAHTFTLAPGQSATTVLHWGAVAGSGDRQTGTCQPTPARIEVTPPNATRHLVLPWRGGPVCERGRIVVTPFVHA
jgi:Protein of unknown function (DUF4232)